ncbi:MAG: hypothetical protein NC203_12040, partial [Firmicutes bacterium]|nr:hypothetical protein [Bacillota bacterium]
MDKTQKFISTNQTEIVIKKSLMTRLLIAVISLILGGFSVFYMNEEYYLSNIFRADTNFFAIFNFNDITMFIANTLTVLCVLGILYGVVGRLNRIVLTAVSALTAFVLGLILYEHFLAHSGLTADMLPSAIVVHAV